MSTIAERQAAFRLAADTHIPLVQRTWHGAQIVDGEFAGTRGFLFACPHTPGLFQVRRPAMQGVVCCVPRAVLAGFPTRHGGEPCPGDTCDEGEAL